MCTTNMGISKIITKKYKKVDTLYTYRIKNIIIESITIFTINFLVKKIARFTNHILVVHL